MYPGIDTDGRRKQRGGGQGLAQQVSYRRRVIAARLKRKANRHFADQRPD